jgi:hypothetical protein
MKQMAAFETTLPGAANLQLDKLYPRLVAH